jgi:hypothetical protein
MRACGDSPGTPPGGRGKPSCRPADSRTASYFDPPDRVWDAIQMTLEEQGYEVESEDRLDGIIHAVSGEGDEAVALRIDQVFRTDIVRVHVRPDGEVTDRSDAAVADFLALLDSTMKGMATPTPVPTPKGPARPPGYR